MRPLLEFVDFAIGTILNLYWWVVILSVIIGWLMAFNVVNSYNPTVRSIWHALNVLTEPLLRPIRRMLPNLGAIDISPVILLVGCSLLEFFLRHVVIRGWLLPAVS